MISIVSWNIAGRRKRLAGQIDSLLNINADIICLQEVIKSTILPIKTRLEENGYQIIDNANYETSTNRIGPRKYSLLTASKFDLQAVDTVYEIEWTEKYLSGMILTNAGAMSISNTHIPPGASNKTRKIETIAQIQSYK